ncbi:MAG: sporulation initiation factor Spo0A C-terminal domain-containing protein [Agathobaculum sp.]|uniref:sporulation initiation factor Spo0A C-terminal domain-containing protein n=1 Tax=Agathobaculum sp. TaxID=2048138 RepID=UPI003D90A246
MEFMKKTAALMQQSKTLVLAGTAENGDEAVKRFLQCAPDIVVLDNDLPLTDGMTAAARIHKYRRDAGILIMSSFMGAQTQMEGKVVGADVLLRKPVQPASLCERLLIWSRAVALCKSEQRQADMRRRLKQILSELAVPLTEMGYRYLTDCVCLRTHESGAMTKVIYPEVAKTYGRQWEDVERVLRYAVHKIWKEGNREALFRYFGESYVNQHKSIGNGMFCGVLAEYLQLEEQE